MKSLTMTGRESYEDFASKRMANLLMEEERSGLIEPTFNEPKGSSLIRFHGIPILPPVQKMVGGNTLEDSKSQEVEMPSLVGTAKHIVVFENFQGDEDNLNGVGVEHETKDTLANENINDTAVIALQNDQDLKSPNRKVSIQSQIHASSSTVKDSDMATKQKGALHRLTAFMKSRERILKNGQSPKKPNKYVEGRASQETWGETAAALQVKSNADINRLSEAIPQPTNGVHSLPQGINSNQIESSASTKKCNIRKMWQQGWTDVLVRIDARRECIESSSEDEGSLSVDGSYLQLPFPQKTAGDNTVSKSALTSQHGIYIRDHTSNVCERNAQEGQDFDDSGDLERQIAARSRCTFTETKGCESKTPRVVDVPNDELTSNECSFNDRSGKSSPSVPPVTFLMEDRMGKDLELASCLQKHVQEPSSHPLKICKKGTNPFPINISYDVERPSPFLLSKQQRSFRGTLANSCDSHQCDCSPDFPAKCELDFAGTSYLDLSQSYSESTGVPDSTANHAENEECMLEHRMHELEERHKLQHCMLLTEQQKERAQLLAGAWLKNAQAHYQGPASSVHSTKAMHSAASSEIASEMASSSCVSSVTKKPSFSKLIHTGNRAKASAAPLTSAFLKKAYERIAAICKGFLTRRLLQTEKLKHLRQTVQDTSVLLEGLQIENQTKMVISSQDLMLEKQVTAQLHAALSEVHNIFHLASPAIRMCILQRDRDLQFERKQRQMDKLLNLSRSQQKPTAKRQTKVVGGGGPEGRVNLRRELSRQRALHRHKP
uniref:centriolar coiled-coil protein of 110 kDa isoform X2 n=1 Tax=Myxine glutinosa TaxID=7769 RepID=UPI00358F7800